MCELLKSKCGLTTLKYNNKYIHSKYNPQKEAEQFARCNVDSIKEENIVLYGLGLGYHVEEIKKLMNNKSSLYVFEYNNILIRYCKEINSQVFNYDNIKIISGSDSEFYNKLSKCISLTNKILIHRPSLETISNSNEKLYNLINDFCLRIQYYNAEPERIEIYEENIKENSLKKYPIIGNLLDNFKLQSKSYVIASAGPSLDLQINLLKDYRKYINIICVGSALRTLITNGIKPDIIVIIDGGELVRKQFEGLENEKVPLCFNISASRWAVNSYNGPKYIFGDKKENMQIEVSSTVTVSAIDIAIKCNASEVVLLGQDLAYIDGKSHTKTYEKTYGVKDVEKGKNRSKTVLGVNGEILETSIGYIGFKHKIEQLIGKYQNIKFINCSKGAVINGTIYMEFKDFLENIN